MSVQEKRDEKMDGIGSFAEKFFSRPGSPSAAPRRRAKDRRYGAPAHAVSGKIKLSTTENHGDVALWFMYYNFCRVYQTLRVTPAMEAGLESLVWAIEELVYLLELQVAEVAS